MQLKAISKCRNLSLDTSLAIVNSTVHANTHCTVKLGNLEPDYKFLMMILCNLKDYCICTTISIFQNFILMDKLSFSIHPVMQWWAVNVFLCIWWGCFWKKWFITVNGSGEQMWDNWLMYILYLFSWREKKIMLDSVFVIDTKNSLKFMIVCVTVWLIDFFSFVFLLLLFIHINSLRL